MVKPALPAPFIGKLDGVSVSRVCYQFVIGDWAGMNTRKINKEKTDRLQKGDWHDKRFDRESLYPCV